MPQFKVKSFLEGRENEPAYYEMMNRFAPCVVGKSIFKKRLQTKNTEDGMWTVSDEAFLLLVLENYYDRWVDVFESTQLHSPTNSAKEHEWSFQSDIMPLYTEGGTRFSENFERPAGRNKNKSKGWSEAGMIRYNVLHDMVLEDRSQHKKPFKMWLRAKRSELDERSSRSKQSHATEPKVQLKTQLFEMVGSRDEVHDDSGGDDTSSEGSDNINVRNDDEDDDSEEEA